jgi:hypothetical protein
VTIAPEVFWGPMAYGIIWRPVREAEKGRAGEVVLALDVTGSIAIFPTIIDPLGFQGALDWAAIGR